MKQPIVTPFLWFNNSAHEAATFYLQVFSRAGKPTSGGEAKGMAVEFELDGQHLIAFNGGPTFKLNEAFSLSVSCQSQAEIDYFWDALVEGGSPSRCGWLKDRFGVSWQIVPWNIGALLKSSQAVTAMMGMAKLDIEVLEKAGKAKA